MSAQTKKSGRKTEVKEPRIQWLAEAAIGVSSSAPVQVGASANGSVQDEHHLQSIQSFLKVARQSVSMDVAVVSRLTESTEVITAFDGDAASFGFSSGKRFGRPDSYSQRMLDGRIGHVVSDAQKDSHVANLPMTLEGHIGSFLGVPIKFSGDELYGFLSCFSHTATRKTGAEDVSFLCVISRFIADQLQQQQFEQDNRQLKNANASMQAIMMALEARDSYAGGRTQQIVELARGVARRLGLREELASEITQVALLHDLGKIGIPDSVLQKHGPLSDREWDIIRSHPLIGERIVSESEDLAYLAPSIRALHERWDGSGYPDGLAGDQIPLASRVVLACDAYFAMTSERPYRKSLTPDQAIQELTTCAGAQLDPRIATALVDIAWDQAAVYDQAHRGQQH